eukprot:2989642-Rhodomonas_salina.3
MMRMKESESEVKDERGERREERGERGEEARGEMSARAWCGGRCVSLARIARMRCARVAALA